MISNNIIDDKNDGWSLRYGSESGKLKSVRFSGKLKYLKTAIDRLMKKFI